MKNASRVAQPRYRSQGGDPQQFVGHFAGADVYLDPAGDDPLLMAVTGRDTDDFRFMRVLDLAKHALSEPEYLFSSAARELRPFVIGALMAGLNRICEQVLPALSIKRAVEAFRQHGDQLEQELEGMAHEEVFTLCYLLISRLGKARHKALYGYLAKHQGDAEIS